jgi:hypothetical protein
MGYMSNCEHRWIFDLAHHGVRVVFWGLEDWYGRDWDWVVLAGGGGGGADVPDAATEAADGGVCVAEDVPGMRADYAAGQGGLPGVREGFGDGRGGAGWPGVIVEMK